MKQYAGLQFEPFEKGDVEAYTPIMKRSFDEDTRRHLNEDSGGPPGYDNGDFLRQWALHERATAYKILKDGQPVGVIILWINANHENYLGCVFIDVAYQDKGIGQSIWAFVESEHPETVVWRTETPGFSKRNHNFYVNKCGFMVVSIENPGKKYEESYHLEKVMKPAA